MASVKKKVLTTMRVSSPLTELAQFLCLYDVFIIETVS